MALQVWLPLNGNLENRGLSDLTFHLVDSYTKPQDGGKIAPLSYINNSQSSGGIISNKTLQIGDNLSMFAWVKLSEFNGEALTNLTGIGGMHTIKHLSDSDWLKRTGMGITVHSSGKIGFNWGDGNGGLGYTHQLSEQSITLNNWHHIGFTCCKVGNTSTITLYIDGKKDTEIYTIDNIQNPDDYVHLFSWSRDGESSTPALFSNYKPIGQINDFRIYDHALSVTEVKLLSQGLVAHYPLKAPFLPNLLQGAEQYTKENPLIRHANVNESNSLQDSYVYHEEITVNIRRPGRYIFVLNADGVPRNHVYDADNTAENRKYMICLRNKTNGAHPIWEDFQIAKDGRHYGFLDIGSAGEHDLRTNLYLYNNIGSNYTVRFWDMQLFECDQYIPEMFEPVSISNAPTSIRNRLGLDKCFSQDTSGYGHNAELVGDIEAAGHAPIYPNCGYFDGLSYLESNCSTFGLNDLTLSAWVYPYANGPSNDTTSNDRSCIVIGGAYITITPAGDEKAIVSTYFYGKNDPGYHNSNSTINIGEWSHLAAVWDDTNKTHRIYINGKCDKTVENCYGPSNWQENTDYAWHSRKYIGREVWWHSSGHEVRDFNGLISDVRIYSTPLTESEIVNLYGSTNTTTATEIIETNFIPTDNTTSATFGGNFTEIDAPLSNMKIKALPDGSTWARVHSLDLTEQYSCFTDAEVIDCDKFGKYSKMGLIDNFYYEATGYKEISGYEFLLNYPAINKTLPEGYTQLEYIESYGEQAISTGITEEALWQFDITFKKGLVPLIPRRSEKEQYSTEDTTIILEYDDNSHVNPNYLNWVYRAFDRNNETSADICYGQSFGKNIKIGYQNQWFGFHSVEKIKLNAYVDHGTKIYSGKIECKYKANTTSNESTHTITLNEENFVNNQDLWFDVSFKYLKSVVLSVSSTDGYGVIINELQIYGDSMAYGQRFSGWQISGGPYGGEYSFINSVGYAIPTNRDAVAYNRKDGDSWLYANGIVVKSTNWVQSEDYILFSDSLDYFGSCCFAKLYGCSCIQDNKIVRQFIPASRDQDGAVGLYDLVENKFYLNYHSQYPSFIAGPKVKKFKFLEYLESDGSSYINTNFTVETANQSDVFEVEAIVSTSGITGNRDFLFAFDNPNYNHYAEFNASGYFGCLNNYIGAAVTQNTKYKIKMRIDGGASVTHSIDGTSGTTNSYASTTWGTFNLFRINDIYVGRNVRIHQLKMYYNGQLVREYAPVMDETGQLGMLDLVGNKFYTNAGSGEFIMSNYTQLEYIESTGAQYMDTGVIPSSTLETEISFTPTGGLTEHAIFGSSWAADGYFLMFYHNQIRWHSGGNWVDIGSYSAGDKVVCHCTNNHIIVNGIVYSINGGENTANTIKILDNMGYVSTDSGKGIGKIEYVKMWENGKLIKDFVPAKYSDGRIGLYDLISKTFYGNLGSGSFEAGPKIRPEIQPPIIEQYNRWIQTDSPNVNYRQTADYLPIHTDFSRWNGSKYDAGPITKSFDQEHQVYLVNSSNDQWAPIGQKENYGSNGIKAANNTTQQQVELWIRVDRMPEATEVKTNDGCVIAPQFIEY